MNLINFLAVGFIFYFLFPSTVLAQVVINEFSSGSSNEDWVELYNTSNNEINLSSYTLVDGSSSGNTKTFSCNLAPYGFYVVEWSNKLNNPGDIIMLKKGESVVSCVAYGNGAGQTCEGREAVDLENLADNQFGALSQDGIGTWQINSTSTKDGPNDGSKKDVGAICATPTSTPTPKPTSTNIPTAKPTYTPTPTFVFKETLTPTIKAISTQKPTVTTQKKEKQDTEIENPVLGLRNELSLTPTPPTDKKEKGDFPIGASLLILGGLSFIGAAGYPFFKKTKLFQSLLRYKRREYNVISDKKQSKLD